MKVYDSTGSAKALIGERFPHAKVSGALVPGAYDAAVFYGEPPTAPALRRARNVLRPDGRIYVSCPNGRREGALQATRLIDLAHLLQPHGRIEKLAATDDGSLVAVLAPGKRRGKVAVWTGNAIGPWHPRDIVTRGLGGSETAAWRLAEELAKLGYQVTLYGHFDADELHGDVILRDFRRYDPTRPLDALIGFRNAPRFDRRPNARVTLLWLEDLAPAEQLTPERAENIDRICAVSEWHRWQILDTHPWLAGSKVIACRNGIEHSYFDGKPPEREKRVVYTSSPDRGLDVILELWPEIKARVPDAEFISTYSRWYDLVAEAFPQTATHRKQIMELSEQDGCSRVKGGLGQRDLALLMRSSAVWCHPSWYTIGDDEFHETSCISAMEAQAAGCVVVASNWGALTETVQVGSLIDGNPTDPKSGWRERFIDKIVAGLTDPEVQGVAQTLGPEMVKDMDWQGAAEQVASLLTPPRNGFAPAVVRGPKLDLART